MMTGVPSSFFEAAKSWRNCHPDRPGILRSRKIRSGRRSRQIRIPSMPSPASETMQGTLARHFLRM